MSDLWISSGLGVLILVFGLAGMAMQRFLPTAHLDSGARTLIQSVLALVALLLSLALGTLVGSAFTFFSTQKGNVELMCDRVILVDNALAEFGQEAAWDRVGLREYIQDAYRDIWINNGDPRRYDLKPLILKFRDFDRALSALQAKTPQQTQALGTINGSIGVLEQTRLLMALQYGRSVSWPLIVILVSWATMLYFGYGLQTQPNSTAIVVAVFGAVAIASALFLILELNQPFAGLFRIPPSTVQQTLLVIGK